MSAQSNRLGDLLLLPEEERARLAFALLDSIAGPDPHGETPADDFRREIHRRVDLAFQSPGDSLGWAEAEALIRGSANKK